MRQGKRLTRIVLNSVGAMLALFGFTCLIAVLSLSQAAQSSLVLILFGNNGTRQAPWFDEQKFSTVHSGMKEEDVFSLLGPPLYSVQECNGARSTYHLSRECFDLEKFRNTCSTTSKDTLVYAHQGGGTSDYLIRVVSLANGIVTATTSAVEFD